MHWAQMGKVYSYTRFSTPEQAAGDSYRRQTEAAQKWAAARGLVLDDRLSFSVASRLGKDRDQFANAALRARCFQDVTTSPLYRALKAQLQAA
jgi:hypothetical protein